MDGGLRYTEGNPLNTLPCSTPGCGHLARQHYERHAPAMFNDLPCGVDGCTCQNFNVEDAVKNELPSDERCLTTAEIFDGAPVLRCVREREHSGRHEFDGREIGWPVMANAPE